MLPISDISRKEATNMRDPSRVRVTGPLAPYALGFAAELSRVGYRKNSSANQLRLLAHLSRWLDEGRIGTGEITLPIGTGTGENNAAGHHSQPLPSL